ncbi:phosphoenolpyruvate carboxykinase (ATP), partial [Candidatus Cardinium sp. cBcalN2]|uniref:phosphoenolpyruvate carboxykinase (ATP) n=1 Tax=Candidatus Cardinium sp. cBcalN2 TaxID=2699436 RepID=UPI001FB2FF1E
MKERPIPYERTIYTDLSVEQLIQQAVARDEGVLAANGALSVRTGSRTGRSPKDRFIVKTADIADEVVWGKVNQPIEENVFESLWQRAQDYLATIDIFIAHLQVGADAQYYLPVTIISEYAWHNLFAYQLFIRPEDFHGQHAQPTWTILTVPGLLTKGIDDGVYSDAALVIHLTERKVLLCGHQYAGEIKKAMFSVLSYWLPKADVLPMHCSANVGKSGDVALFFGLSGTGKTTLSADPKRYLMGDDEHGWSAHGLFNFEGGCYAKCINLSPVHEPVIWNAIRYGAIMENVTLDPKTLEPDYADSSLTQNSRVAYPIDYVEQRIPRQRVDRSPASIIFLTCDLYGVLPAVARLTEAQAAYYFLSGYTALVGSTEIDQAASIQTTFSTCFGAPFFPRPASVYVALFSKRLSTSGAQVYLVNTGWTGGSYGQGYRFPISVTRTIIDAILNGQLKTAEYSQLPGFNLAIPKALPGLDATLLDPRKTWGNLMEYHAKAKALIALFLENAKRFTISPSIQAAAPVLEYLFIIL